MSDDKYPAESGRRRFVKGVVGGATLAGVGATGAVSINSATSAAGAGGGNTVAMAIENTGGPAPRGMPQIPVEIVDGQIKGAWPEIVTEMQEGVEVQVARTEDFKGTGVTYAGDWFQYCGLEALDGLSPNFESDNIIRSSSSSPYGWQSDGYEGGDPLLVEDFGDYETWGNDIGSDGVGKPATGRWRSEGTDDTIPVTVIRSSAIEEAAQEDPWLEASTDQGFIAWVNKCTHFCCVPGYKQLAGSEQYGAEDGVYCQCHQSVYDPFNIVETLFVARPRPL
jgi:Rieske Fe-S protein